MTVRHPSIFKIGRVADDGETVRVTGWGVGLCQAGCACHRHPTGGHLVVSEDEGVGTLGLRKFRPCDCCQPWTADELAAIVRDLAELESA